MSFCGRFNQIEEFLTVLSPNMYDKHLKNESKMLMSMDILEHWAVIKKLSVQAGKSPMEAKSF